MRISISQVFKGAKNFASRVFNHIFNKQGNIREELLEVIDTKLLDLVDAIILPAIKRNLIKNESLFTLNLFNSLYFSQESPGKVVLYAGLVSHYGRILEEGSGPREIDEQEAEKIVQWVMFKMQVEGQKARNIADHVIQKIQMQGSDAHPYIAPALEETLQSVEAQFGKEISVVFGLDS